MALSGSTISAGRGGPRARARRAGGHLHAPARRGGRPAPPRHHGDALLDGLGLASAWVFLDDEKGGKIRLAAHRGVSPAYLEMARSRGLGECLCRE